MESLPQDKGQPSLIRVDGWTGDPVIERLPELTRQLIDALSPSRICSIPPSPLLAKCIADRIVEQAQKRCKRSAASRALQRAENLRKIKNVGIKRLLSFLPASAGREILDSAVREGVNKDWLKDLVISTVIQGVVEELERAIDVGKKKDERRNRKIARWRSNQGWTTKVLREPQPDQEVLKEIRLLKVRWSHELGKSTLPVRSQQHRILGPSDVPTKWLPGANELWSLRQEIANAENEVIRERAQDRLDRVTQDALPWDQAGTQPPSTLAEVINEEQSLRFHTGNPVAVENPYVQCREEEEGDEEINPGASIIDVAITPLPEDAKDRFYRQVSQDQARCSYCGLQFVGDPELTNHLLGSHEMDCRDFHGNRRHVPKSRAPISTWFTTATTSPSVMGHRDIDPQAPPGRSYWGQVRPSFGNGGSLDLKEAITDIRSAMARAQAYLTRLRARGLTLDNEDMVRGRFLDRFETEVSVTEDQT